MSSEASGGWAVRPPLSSSLGSRTGGSALTGPGRHFTGVTPCVLVLGDSTGVRWEFGERRCMGLGQVEGLPLSGV